MHSPMFAYDEGMTDLVLDYCRRRLALDPVPLDLGGHAAGLDDVLDGLIGPTGHDPHQVLDLFVDRLATAVVSSDSPRSLSFIPAAPTKASLLFDMVVSCSSLSGTSWLEAAGAIAAENQALGVLASLAGLPAGAGGCFVSGGSAANLSALMVARDSAALKGGDARRARIAVSDEVHSSVTKALQVLALEPFTVPTVDHRLIGSALEAALAADPDGAGEVVGVVATAGTTNAGLVDDLAGIAAVARDRGLWFHVDAAYGGAALFSRTARDRFAGIEHVDSFVVDPHKWLFAPFDCAALIYRRPSLAKAVHAQEAAYLDVIHGTGRSPGDGATGDAPRRGVRTEWNPTDYAFHLTRRPRGLPLWFSLAVHGTDAYRDAVETVLANARGSAALIRATPHAELVREPELSIVLFRRPGWERERYATWSARLLGDQVAFVTPTTWEGRPVARLALLHPDTTPAIVAEILSTMA